mmetsp:Transcript_17035/g.23835  ORF Transcript_17035/g.23835 Transcript_17035/m.23835 type:complete len:164 (-) Transcript_17035:262-753(-)
MGLALCKPKDGGDALPDPKVNMERTAAEPNKTATPVEKKAEVTADAADSAKAGGSEDAFADMELPEDREMASDQQEGQDAAEDLGLGDGDLDEMPDDDDVTEKATEAKQESTTINSGPKLFTMEDMKNLNSDSSKKSGGEDPAEADFGFGADDLDDMPDDGDL